MAEYLICTPIFPKLSHDGNTIEGISPQVTTWINMDQIAYATAGEYFVERTEETQEYVQVVLVDGTSFNVLASDWKRSLSSDWKRSLS